ncbi:MAG: putative pyruvate ferredoxin oxidoreductase, gamma subunit [Parcubacteria group bacterium GW2011_GWA2_47_7]|nr:MAG: putative pyruvate ferredoxin oxidoreductase, gamma subunit [Parcubacteria group bacterium GW2011_GWA2_47_7]
MIKIRINGRGGQGGVTASGVLSSMMMAHSPADKDKYPYVMSCPDFGPERRGAPVSAYIRLDMKPIRELAQFPDPDMVIVFDGSLAMSTNVANGLAKGGLLLINSKKLPADFAMYTERFRVFSVDAEAIAVECGLGTKTSPIVSTALLGAFMRASKLATLDSLLEYIEKGISKKTDANKRAARFGYDLVRAFKGEWM